MAIETKPISLGIEVNHTRAIRIKPIKVVEIDSIAVCEFAITLCDKILDDVCACQKDETVVRTVESSLALVEDMYCRIDAPHGLVYHFEGFSNEDEVVRLTKEESFQEDRCQSQISASTR